MGQEYHQIALQEQHKSFVTVRNHLRKAKKLNIKSVSQYIISKKISNVQELIQSDPTSCPQNQKGNN